MGGSECFGTAPDGPLNQTLLISSSHAHMHSHTQAQRWRKLVSITTNRWLFNDGLLADNWPFSLCRVSVLKTTLVKCLIDYTSSRIPNADPIVQAGYDHGPEKKRYTYDVNTPLIFIGGMPRSGTTLARAMLDAHPDIRCGEETRVIPRLLQMRNQWLKSTRESARLVEAGLDNEVLNSAMAAFFLEVIARHGEPAPRLCNKDPFTLKSAVYLSQLFPNSKFIFMVRDGRATVHSIISRHVTISGFDLTDYRQCLSKWNAAVQLMYLQCKEVGPDRCLRVYYEQLVLHPREQMDRILEFLVVPWNESVLHHEQFINKPGGISLSKMERSSDQVVKPVNLEALSKWVGHIPDDCVRDMASVAPMLAMLGYDPNGNPPNYGNPDSFVIDNTKDIRENSKHWSKLADEVVAGKKYPGSADTRQMIKDQSEEPRTSH
uniref:Protein-tyrosine sulfotransferase n=1 Tax=Strigamia maritima TaxID=126957 RepID=T1J9P8_STRMM